MIDTVEHAATTPDQPQPFHELGLKDDEYQRIREILGRRPTDTELAMYSVMWSEHCSYKSSKVHLRYFGETTTDEMRAGMLAGIGENAGVVDIGDGWAVTFKVESHNHPSYVEPYQGAATGVGGIVRDIMAMGARPVAVMDQLRFGAADAPDTRRVLDGVVRGIGGYGNSLGLPNIGGETVFDACYAGNPLVNALCVGVLRQEDLHLAFASGTGNKIILFGARTGLDGIGGVSVLASDTFDGDEAARRKKLPSVQVGDPFMEKVLIECCLELYAGGLVIGIQDLGGAGLSCATSELASAGDGGMAIELDTVPLRRQADDTRRDALQRVAGADVRGGRAGERRCLPGGVPQVGSAGHRDRRGHRRRPVAHHLARRDRRRRAAAHRGPRRSGVPASGGPPRIAGRVERRLVEEVCPDRPPATNCARLCLRCWAVRTCAAVRSSPSSTTGTCAATPCWPSTPTAACCASTRRPVGVSRCRPTPRDATPCWIPTPVPNSRWPRPTATWPSPALPRSR